MRSLERVCLPDGAELWCLNPLEADVLYREIVSERTYERHGITLDPGAVVFDAGANIGLFSAHLARTVPGVRLHAFEPIPIVFEALRRNLAEHAPTAAVHQTALGAAAGEATFTLDPSMSLATTMVPAEVSAAVERRATVTRWAQAAIDDMQRVRPGPMVAAVSAALRRPLARPFALAGLAAYAGGLEIRKRLRASTHVCPVTTVSAAIAAAGIDRIDLLKVDVEGAEEAVLHGIDDSDWARIRQLVIEVHNVNGRPARLRALLDSRGYRTVDAREDWALHELLGISTLYALRA